MDITDTLAPNSDQLDAVDLAATGPRVFTVKSVSKGDPEQPVQVHLVEFPRGPWRPGKNMRRVLAACWGADASAWAGRRVELYCDAAVMFGREAVGGIRIVRLSHIDKVQQVPLIVSRGKSAVYTVQPLRDAGAGREPAPARDPQGEGGHRVSAGESPAGPTGASGEDPASPEPLHLALAVERQMDAFTAHQTKVVVKFCEANGIKPTRDGFIEAWGERARDIAECIGATS